MRNALGGQGEVFRLEWCIRLETDHVTLIAHVELRTLARADRASLQAMLVEINGAEVFAIAAVLPLEFGWSVGLTLEVDFAQQVTAILTLDGILARSEKSSFVFGAKYSHVRSSLQRRVTIQVVPGAKHDTLFGGDLQTLTN